MMTLFTLTSRPSAGSAVTTVVSGAGWKNPALAGCSGLARLTACNPLECQAMNAMSAQLTTLCPPADGPGCLCVTPGGFTIKELAAEIDPVMLTGITRPAFGHVLRPEIAALS